MKYTVKDNQEEIQVAVDYTYAIYYDDLPIVFIPGFYKDSKGVAEAIAKILNDNRKIIINTDI